MKTLRFQFRRRKRQGMIFLTALGIIVILTGLLLAFSQNMRSEALASANRVSSLQADAVEQGAEQWVMAQIDLNATTGNNSTPDSWTLVYSTPAEAIPLGSGYFWLIRPNENTDQDYDYGIIDESSKLNLNATALTADIMLALPTDMTSDVADAVLDWKNPVAQASADGAETDYYNSLPEPYDCKNEPFETVEEMQLVRGITPQTLYGYDLNHDGVFDASEQAAGGAAASVNSATNDPRGIFRYLTVYSKGATALTPAAAGGGGAGGGGAAAAGGTTVPAGTGLVNVNTASETVLMALGLTQSQADTIISQRAGAALTDAASVQQALSGAAPPATFFQQTTATSYQYSADIVAVSGDGRAYKRVRIVVDCSPATSTTGTTGGATGGAAGGTTGAGASATANTPSQIIYRRDLTGLGWPLPPEIRTALRSGRGIQAGGSGGGSSMISVGNH